MLSLRQSFHSQTFDFNKSFLWRLLASKVVRFLLTALFVASLVLAWLRSDLPLPEPHSLEALSVDAGAGDQALDGINHSQKGRLHLLIPATSSNEDLCKILLSVQILGYPTPILINYGDAENENAYVQHLAKVEGILKYLDDLHTSTQFSQDLVLIVDGYDVWFQLRPDVLIKRYYEWQQAADSRARGKYGDTLFKDHDSRHTILFGPDKLCWPVDYNRPACWAVPEAPLPEYVIGPCTADGRLVLNMPKWLNSGTIMGPVEDLKELFRKTLDDIHNKYETNSDQFYFANIWGEQEYARISRKPELLEYLKGLRYGNEKVDPNANVSRTQPDLESNAKTEYHIGLDYNSSVFQTIAFYKQFLTVMRPVDSWIAPKPEDLDARDRGVSARQRKHVYNVQLPADIQESLPPLEALKVNTEIEMEEWPAWADMPLHYNTVTGEVPVVIHFTGDKHLRQFWWQTIWFQSRAQQLRLASRAPSEDPISPRLIHGFTWFNSQPEDDGEFDVRMSSGAVSDLGGWFSWNKLCRRFEEELFKVPGDEFFHYISQDNTEASQQERRSDDEAAA